MKRQFSLRGLFLALTIFGIWLGWQKRIVNRRNEVRRWMDGNSISHDWKTKRPKDISYVREWLGDGHTGKIGLSHAQFDVVGAPLQRLFPEAMVEDNPGRPYGDWPFDLPREATPACLRPSDPEKLHK